MDNQELPFGEPESPARAAWRKLFGEPARPTPHEMNASWRAIDAALERAFAAIAAGNVQQLQLILRDSPGLAQNASADLVRHAIECNQSDVLEALLEAGLPADRIDENGTTALMDAAGEGHVEMARRLLQAGADPNVLPEHHDRKIDAEAFGQSALYFALCRDDRALIDLLSPVTRPEIRALAHLAHERWQQDARARAGEE